MTSGASSPGDSRASEPGKHDVTLACKQTGATLETSFFVQGAAAERVGRPARPEVLEEIARVTRGKVIEPDKLDEVVRSLAELPDPPPVGATGPVMVPPGAGGGSRRPARGVLGGPQGDRFSMMELTSTSTTLGRS